MILAHFDPFAFGLGLVFASGVIGFVKIYVSAKAKK